MAAALVIAFYAGKLAGNVRLSAPNAAEGALEQTGLPGEYAPSYALHGAADGRDSFAQTLFCVEREREELLQRMSRTEGWRVAEAGAEDYRRFAETAMWSCQAAVQVRGDAAFDAWYYRETAGPYNAPASPTAPSQRSDRSAGASYSRCSMRRRGCSYSQVNSAERRIITTAARAMDARPGG